MNRSELAIAVLLAVGCTPPVAGTPDDVGSIDGGTTLRDAYRDDAFTRDAGRDASSPRDAGSDARADAGRPPPRDASSDAYGDAGPYETHLYVFADILTECGDDGLHAPGLNVDGMMDGDPAFACTASPDFVSCVTGATDVDSQLSTVTPTLDTMLDPSMRIPARIRRGEYLVGLELTVHSFDDDPSVVARLVRLSVPGGGPPMLDGSGDLLAGQGFQIDSYLSELGGSITGGQLDVLIGDFPLELVSSASLPIRGSRLQAVVSSGTITGAEIGGRTTVDDMLVLTSMFLAGVDRATIEALTQPDLEPDATGEHCNAISVGLGVDLRPVTMASALDGGVGVADAGVDAAIP